MDDEEKDRLEGIVNNLNKDVKMPPYNNSSKENYSREYKNYQEEEELERQRNQYERLCLKKMEIFLI